MANKAKKDNKNLIIGICAAVVVVIVIVVAVILANRGAKLDDSYFVSDDTKYVLTVNSDDSEDNLSLVKTHLVYKYSGDTITELKSYYEFANAEDAKAAFDEYKEAYAGSFKSAELNGKYIIFTANEEDYSDLTASDVKQQIEFMEMLEGMDLTDDTEEEEVETKCDEDDTKCLEEETVEE